MSSNSSKQPRSGGDHGYGYGSSSGYGYGGYGYGGYGYGGYGSGGKREGGLQRSLQDYVLILRERIWYIIVVFLVVFSSALVYTLSQTKIYSALATMTVQRRGYTVLDNNKGNKPGMEDLIGPEELGTLLSVFHSGAVLTRVAEKLRMNGGADLREFMAAYGSTGGPIGPEDFLNGNRSVVVRRGTFVLEVRYRHPNPAIAAKVANYFTEAYLDYKENTISKADVSMVAELKLRVTDQEKKVAAAEKAIDGFKRESGNVSLSEKSDTIRKTLYTNSSRFDEQQSELNKWTNISNQVDQYIKDGRDLTELPIISGGPIGTLKGQIASANIEISQMETKYGEKWPFLITAKEGRKRTEQELKIAVANAVALVHANASNARDNLEATKALMEKAKEDVRQLDGLAIEYDKLELTKRTAISLLQELQGKLANLSQTASLDPSTTSMLDRAGAPDKDDYVSPNMTINLSLGVAAGLGLGLVFAFFVAYIDDRVKSSFDIESVIGLPLVGIIPQIKKMEQPDKAQIVANNADRQVSEAFLALHSALRLKDESKNGQCILITSTIPGEGKSFVTTNLALTFAAHGERVLIIDCDLRKPNIHKSFRQENLKGVIDVIAGGVAFDDVVIKQLHPNLDVLTSGGRAKNPTQILNSKKFEIMVSDLRKRYDRVFFDTPPLAAVSDALIILPLMDGSLFSIFFNKVRRKAAQFAAKKLLEANVSVYGAVLNGLNLSVSGYYYAQYYDKSYKDYYVVMSKSENAPPSKE